VCGPASTALRARARLFVTGIHLHCLCTPVALN
jgi:hypothetical protein